MRREPGSTKEQILRRLFPSREVQRNPIGRHIFCIFEAFRQVDKNKLFFGDDYTS